MTEVSVILPCFNAASSIRSSVQSILDQTFKDWELIVVDDASTDHTIDELNDITDKRIKLIRLGKNSGYPVAMNEGIARANGKYIARMDADDVSASTRLQEQLKTLELNPKASFCGVARYRITPGGKMYADGKKYESLYVYETWDNLMQGNRIFTDPSVMITKEKIKEVGGYRTFQRSGMDVDLWLRVMEKFGPCITITKPLFGKGLEPGSLIFNPNTNLINQVPRVLARQRIEKGVDDIQTGKGVNIVEYKLLGWVKEEAMENKPALFLGSLVTCLWLLDWRGARIYYQQIRRTSDLSLLKITFELAKKILQRLRSNPYIRYHQPA
jgi:glycosyltransferase involved in cell wall biosynthesis